MGGKVLELYKFEDHLRDCDERYKGVIRRLDSLDEKMSRVEQLLIEINQHLSVAQTNQ